MGGIYGGRKIRGLTEGIEERVGGNQISGETAIMQVWRKCIAYHNYRINTSILVWRLALIL